IGPARPAHRGGGQQHKQPAGRRAEALPLEKALPLVERALKALERREGRPQVGVLKSTMLPLGPAVTGRGVGTGPFSDFVHKMASAGIVRLHKRDGNFVVERVEAREEAAPQPTLTREDAIAPLRSVLDANLSFVAVGIPAKELAALFHAAHPRMNLR